MEQKTSENYSVALDEFEGPLDLLLNLIEEEELDITRVSLARVTDQYLGHIEAIEEEDHEPEKIVDFLMIASQLMVIKSKALLPLLVLDEEEELDAKELEFRLKQLKIFRDYAVKLEKQLQSRVMLYERRLVLTDNVHFAPPEGITAADLKVSIQGLLDALPQDEFLEEEHIQDTMSTKDKIITIKRNLNQISRMNFQDLVTDKASKIEVVVTFLAMLELLKQRTIKVEQDGLFGEITLEPTGLTHDE